MSNKIWSAINPLTTSGVMLAGLLDDFKDSLVSGNSGTSRPPNLQAGGTWIDTTFQAAPDYYWGFKFYTGAVDVEVFRISVLSGYGGALTADATFTVEKISADTVEALLELVKNRIDNNGQLLSGDLVAEIRFKGRTVTGTDPIAAYVQFTATDDMTASASGGTLSFVSTPDATNTLVEHMRFINGLIETLVQHKVNSQIDVSQDVATAATIVQLSAATKRVEMTGATTTTIQGINSAGDSKTITIHNRSTADVTLEHEHASAVAADRMTLQNGLGLVIAPQYAATLFYCTDDSRWKMQALTSKKLARTIEKLKGAYQQWTAPSGVSRIRIVGYGQMEDNINQQVFKDVYGNAYAFGYNAVGVGSLGVGDNTPRSSPVAVVGGFTWKKISIFQYTGLGLTTQGLAYSWGQNTIGEGGLGDVVARSSPVAVLGGLKFANVYTGWDRDYTYGIAETGALYSWGANAFYQLGVGDQNPRSSPVAVLGGLKFSRILFSQGPVMGIARSGDAYAWGTNFKGQSGVGDTVIRSSPVLVLGGLKYKKIMFGQSNILQDTALGLTTSGALYAWGINSKGQLGVGDTTARSSPVAVLGGLTFVDIAISTGGGGGFSSCYAITSNGTMYAWGDNSSGQLGVGDTTARSSPVAVLGGLFFEKIMASKENNIGGHVFGITAAGIAYAWGENSSGQLGVGNTVPRSSPVAVLGGLVFHHIFPGFQNATHGATKDGLVYSWGYNANGELAVGDVTARSSPVAVLGAFGINVNQPIIDKEISVTALSTYDVILSNAQSTFGVNSLGIGIDNITIEYDK